MFDLSTGAKLLKKKLFGESEVNSRIAAGILRTILADITRLYFENVKARGKGLLVFNPENPESSSYLTVDDILNDIALAQEACNPKLEKMLRDTLALIDKEFDNKLPIIAMIQSDSINIHIIDPEETDEKINKLVNGLII